MQTLPILVTCVLIIVINTFGCIFDELRIRKLTMRIQALEDKENKK